jgi:LPXTG-motif cell wall-anchored protein
MRVLDVRWARLAVAAGAIVGSALVSSVAVAADDSPPTEPPVAATPDLASTEVEQHSDDVTIVTPPGTPFEDIAVIEIAAPVPDVVGPGTVDPTVVEPTAAGAGEEPADESVAPPVSDPAAVTSLDTETVGMGSQDEAASEGEGEHGSDHEGGSGGQGNPYQMTFTVVWYDADGQQITTLDVILSPEVLSQFELSATSRTGKGKVTSATCTYPEGGTVLRCQFDNPGHGSGSDGLIIPARPTATYTVSVDPMAGWTISGANGDAYSARNLCPRGSGGGHEEGGHEEGGHEEGGHEEGGHEEGGHEEGGHEEGGHEEGGHEKGGNEEGGNEGGGVPCVHTVVMRQIASTPEPPPPPPTVPPAQDSGVVPPAPGQVVQSLAGLPRSLPATGSSTSMILLAAGVLVIMGSALAGLTRRPS